MKHLKLSAIILALLTCTATWLYSQNNNSPEKKNQNLRKEFYGQQANEKIAGASYVKEGKNTSFPSFVRFLESKQIKQAEFFDWLARTMKLSTDYGFELKSQNTDPKTGITHYRYTQTFKGIPVAQGMYIVHVKDGIVKYFNGNVYEIASSLSPSPMLTENAALETAKQHIGAERYKWEDEYWENRIKERKKDARATYFPKGELCWNSTDLNMVGKAPSFRLAYRFDISAASPAKELRVFIDAVTGALLQTLPMESNCNSASCTTIWNGSRTIYTTESGGTYRLRDDCQDGVLEIRDWNSTTCTASPLDISNGTNTWNNNNNETFGGSVLWATRQSHDYWSGVMLRNSYDNSGGDVDGYINAVFTDCFPDCFVSCRYTDNASMSFSSGTMKVGLGSSMTLANSWGALDIIGHEFAHAVTGAGDAAQLVYQDESGALNESFSDIFGEMVEKNTLGSNDWLMGDDRTNGYIRKMSDPNDKGDPDTYMGDNWFTGTGDNGGVHTNSGVQNFWFYLLSAGGAGTNDNGDSYSVSGVGTAVAAWIAQYNLLNELSSNSDYSDARAGALAAAIDGYGACSNVYKQVMNAWYAVGVGGPYIDVDLTDSDYNGSDISCYGECDGSATANVIGGTFEIYEWSPGGATTSTISNLCPGVYSVTVTDFLGLGCSVSGSITISEPLELEITSISTSNYNGYEISCYGGSDGSATVNHTGGTGAKSYDWSNSGTTKSISGLTAGTYYVTVSDANGCEASGSVTLNQPPKLEVIADPTSDYNGYDVRCFGGSDGFAEAFPTGGVPGYSYEWSDGQTTKVATGLSAINYVVTVTDANLCTALDDTTLTEPPQLTIDAGDNEIVYYGYPDSACTNLTAEGAGGGVPPYDLEWSTGSPLYTINVCPPLTTVYYVTLTDQNNCEVVDSVKVCAIDVRCGNKLDKVTICHGTDGAPVTICVALIAAKNHLSTHAGIDQLAACGTLKVCSFTPPSAKTDEGVSFYIDNEAIEGKTWLAAFPNPFADNTAIRFIVPQDDRVNVRVLDVTGKVVSNLFEGNVTFGTVNQASFDGSKYSNGVYFLTLTNSKGERFVEKLVLTR